MLNYIKNSKKLGKLFQYFESMMALPKFRNYQLLASPGDIFHSVVPIFLLVTFYLR